MQIFSKETKVSQTMKNMKRRGIPNQISPIMKQGSNMIMNIVKLADKDQFPQVSFLFQGIKIYFMDIFSLVEILDIRL
jgi:hypothetical protein